MRQTAADPGRRSHKLQSYDWPGNVRELRNVIERAVILARGGALEFDLPITGQAAPVARPNPPSDSPAGSVAQPKFLTEAELERFERDNLVQALEAANWKISGPDSAAELLGVKPTTLLSRMTKVGLEEARKRTILTLRFFEHTKTRVSSAGHFEGGKLHN